MKKALTVFLMLALVGSVFAAEPVADVNIAEFSGNASVQWGVNSAETHPCSGALILMQVKQDSRMPTRWI